MSDKEMRSTGVQEATANSLPTLGVEVYRSEGVKTNVSSADGLSSTLQSEAKTPKLLQRSIDDTLDYEIRNPRTDYRLNS